MFYSWPLWLLVAAVIKLDSSGPVFFVHERVGKRGRTFKLIKFRTMFSDASPYETTPKDYHDGRITRIGALLRNHGLDEIPQILNVLVGHMSMVGPRPEMPFVVASYNRRALRRLKAKPGLTGLWQILGPKDEPIHHHLEFDLFYVRNRSFVLDFWILMKTIPIFLSGKRRGQKPWSRELLQLGTR